MMNEKKKIFFFFFFFFFFDVCQITINSFLLVSSFLHVLATEGVPLGKLYSRFWQQQEQKMLM